MLSLLNLEAGAARKDAAEANERATANEAQIAEANARAAEALKIAEQERFARVTIEEQLSWRKLTPEQKAKLRSSLRALSFEIGSVRVLPIMGDAEGYFFAAELTQVIREAGWKVVGPNPSLLIPPPMGLYIRTRQTHNAIGAMLQRALEGAGLKTHATLSDQVQAIDVELVVGFKPM